MPDRFDVFCSYSHADGEAVGRLVGALEARGLAVYLDREEILDFEGITGSIERGLARSKALLAYYSASYPTRRPCQWELTAAFLAAQRQGDPRRRVLVVNSEQSPGHIQPVELQDALFRSAPEPDDEPGLAALADSVAAHLAEVEGLLGEVGPLVPPAWHPEQRTGSNRFVGRLAEMWALHSALQASGVGLISGATTAVAQLRGLGGVGKSLLAEEYALRFGAAFPGGVFWLRGFGHGDGSLDPGQREAERGHQLEAFAARLGLEVADLSPDQVEGELGRWFEAQGKPCLWVVDDLPAELDGELRRWLAPHPAAKTLITSRSREYDALGGHVDLAELPEREALELLTKRRQPDDEDERAAAGAIAAELGYHPLALDVAAAALRLQTYPRFLSALREPSEDRLERLTANLRDALPNGHERSIARTLSDTIERLGEAGLDFLRLASVLAAAPLSAELVASVFATVDGLDEYSAGERQLVALDQVVSLSLAEEAGTLSWRVHALVSRTVRFTELAPERREALRDAAIKTFTDELGAIVDPTAHARLEGSVPHARELTRRASDRAGLELLGWVARYDHERGDYRSAIALWRQQHDGNRQVLGEEHPETLTSLSNLGVALRAAGDLAAALELQERALELNRRVFGDEHPGTLSSLNNLALVLEAQGDLAGARELQERALELRRRVLGDEHRDTLTALNNLAATIQAQGDLAGARELHERALELRRQALGDQHPDTLTSLNNLAATLWAQGDLAGARELQERALELRRRVLGEEHPDTLTSLGNLAGTLRDQGDLAGARELQERALELRQRALGDQHPDTLTSLGNLAETLRDQGDLAGAQELHERTLELRQRALGDEHPQTLTSLGNLALVLEDQGDLAGAQELHERTLELRRRVLGDEHPDTLTSLGNLALVLEDQGDLAGARELQERALELRRRVLGDEHPQTLTSLNNLAETLWAQGDLGGARELQERALELSRRVLGEEHPDTLTSLNNLALALGAQGDLGGARELQERALELRRRVLGDEHPDTLTSLNNLAQTLRDQGDLDGARELEQSR